MGDPTGDTTKVISESSYRRRQLLECSYTHTTVDFSYVDFSTR